MSADEHLQPRQFDYRGHNTDPSLPVIMAQFPVISRESVPVDKVMGGVQISSRKARRYANMPTPLPPVVGRQHGDEFIVYDGNHRVEAARLRGQSHIDAYIGREA